MPNLLPIAYIVTIILGLITLIDLWKLGYVQAFVTPLFIGIVVAFSIIICLWPIFERAVKSSWGAVIPVYNWVVLCQIAGYDGRFAWLILVPVVNVIAFLRVCMGLADYFKRSKLFGYYLFLFFPFVLPILAFSKKIQYEYDIKQTAPIPVTLPSVREVTERKAVRERFARAMELEKNGEVDKAVELYGETIGIDSRHTEAYFKRGKLLMSSGSNEAAVADFKKVIELADNPELADLAQGHIARLTETADNGFRPEFIPYDDTGP